MMMTTTTMMLKGSIIEYDAVSSTQMIGKIYVHFTILNNNSGTFIYFSVH